MICQCYAICPNVGYTECFGRISVYLCASSPENIVIPQDFYSLVLSLRNLSLWNDLGDHVFDHVGLGRFDHVGLGPKLLSPFLSSIIFILTFFLWVGIMALGSYIGLIGWQSLSLGSDGSKSTTDRAEYFCLRHFIIAIGRKMRSWNNSVFF